MTATAEIAISPFLGLKTGWNPDAFARHLGERPASVALERAHFPGKRPVTLQFSARLRSGRLVPVLAEYCPGEAPARAEALCRTLAKERHGQAAGLAPFAIVADAASGLVLRRPGLDERLPGLWVLHEPKAARDVVAALTGCDPGPVAARLAAHRLGKRAVIRIEGGDGVWYARLRATKSDDGAARFDRHRAVWRALGPGAPLRVPEPLGTVPDLGLSLFSSLPGAAPDFTRRETSRAVARAIGALAGLAVGDLPAHSGIDEARILGDWLARCREHLPEVAGMLAGPVGEVAARLSVRTPDPVPTHRDLHEKQILVSGGVAGLLDFDTLTLADPALDPGNLLAHLFFAGLPEGALRTALGRPGLSLWRRAALLRLAMIYAFSSLQRDYWIRLAKEACRDDRD